MPNSTNRFPIHFGPACARKLGLLGLAVVTLVASGHLLFNTRTGVHTIFEALGIGADTDEWVASPDAPPVVDVHAATFSHSLSYPGEILQPSGITWDATAQQFLVVTDQAELFAVTADLEELLSSTRMSRAPLVARQGSVETVATIENSAIIGGRDQTLPTWQGMDGVWTRGQRLGAEGYVSPMSGDVMAMASDPDSGRFFAADEDGTLWTAPQAGSDWDPLALEGAVREGRSLEEYRIMGLEYHADRLYALTAHYPNILVIDPASGRIEQVFALEGLRDQSGLAILNGQAFVTVDHEYDEASPGLMVFDLGEPMIF